MKLLLDTCTFLWIVSGSSALSERACELFADPFDRMLACQAIHHGLTVLTPDPQLQQYPLRSVW